MVAGRPKIGAFLIQNGIISAEQLKAAIEHQNSSNCRLGEAVIALGFCTETDIARALAEQLEILYLDLEESPPVPTCVALLPREVALGHGVLPVRMQGNRLVVAVQDPFDIRIDEAVRQATGLQVILAIAPETQLSELLRQHYNETLFEEPPPQTTHDLEEQDDEDQPVSVQTLIATGEQEVMSRSV